MRSIMSIYIVLALSQMVRYMTTFLGVIHGHDIAYIV